MPPAAFSPLTTTKSAPSSSRSGASMARSARRPAEPTTSPTKRIARKGGNARGPSTRGRIIGRWNGGAGASAEPDHVRARAPSSSRAGSRLSRCRWALLALYALLRAAGPVAAIFVVAAVVALLLNPFVALLQERARFPRGLAVLTSSSALIVIVGGAGRGARQADRRPGRAVQRRRARASSTTRTRARRPAATGSTTTASTSRSQHQGADGAADAAATSVVGGLGRARLLHSRPRCRS